MRYSWKFFKWMVLVGCAPTLYFSFIRRLTGITDPCFPFWNNFFIWLLISITITLILSFFVYSEIIWLEKILPWKKQPTKRIIAEVPLVLLTTTALMFPFSHLTYGQHIRSFGASHFKNYADYLVKELTISLVLTLIVVILIECVFFFMEWRKSVVLSEKLQKENMQSQLEVLKNQVNPHFLFNSLNVLSSLVYSDPTKAEKFIEQFASVYRYILNIQGKIVVTLEDELEFLHSYLYLQKIRFNEGLVIQLDIDCKMHGLYLPPLCLQQLVENAIKHNVVGSETPLTIKIYCENDHLVVKNNLQKRNDPLTSTGVGLKNLTDRYFHFANVKPTFEAKDGFFIAKTPLLKMTPED